MWKSLVMMAVFALVLAACCPAEPPAPIPTEKEPAPEEKLDPKTESIKKAAQRYSNIAYRFREQKRYKEAIDFYNKSRAEYEKIKDKDGIGVAFYNIAYCLESQENTSLAITYYLDSKKIFLETGDREKLAEVIDRLGRPDNRCIRVLLAHMVNSGYQSIVFLSSIERSILLFR